jgi:hypothetical protein
MFLKYHCIRKLMYLALPIFLVACAERPIYEPAPAPATTTTGQPKSSTAKTGQDTAKDKTADATNSMTPKVETPPAVSPTPTPTPTPPAAPVDPVGVAATGRTLVMANCLANGACHSASPLNAKDDTMLAAGMNIPAHPAALKAGNYFVKPAAGSQPTNYSHVLAYLKSIATPIMGPNIP